RKLHLERSRLFDPHPNAGPHDPFPRPGRYSTRAEHGWRGRAVAKGTDGVKVGCPLGAETTNRTLPRPLDPLHRCPSVAKKTRTPGASIVVCWSDPPRERRAAKSA